MLIKQISTSSTSRLVLKQSRSSEYLSLYLIQTLIRRQSEYAHKFCAVDIFLKITFCQAISPVVKFHHVLGRGFYDSAGDIEFYQMSLSQSESPILHESTCIILLHTIYKIALGSFAITFFSDKIIHHYQIGLISNRLFVCGVFVGFRPT